MTKEILIARLTELRQIIVNAQANLHAMQGQEIEIKFWIKQFDALESAGVAPPQPRENLTLVKPVDEGAV